jgi:hypothetical protein
MIEELSTIEIKLDTGIGVFFDGRILRGDRRCIYTGIY